MWGVGLLLPDIKTDRPDGAVCTVQSPSFIHRFGAVTEIDLFRHIASYCGAQRGGRLGEAEILLMDTAKTRHLFHFETFSNRYEALTLGVWVRPAPNTANH